MKASYEREEIPFTAEPDYLKAREVFLEHFRGVYYRSIGQHNLVEKSKGTLPDEDVQIALGALERAGYGRVDLLKLLSTTEMDHALDVMAVIRAYCHGGCYRYRVSPRYTEETFTVAMKRFCDNVCQIVDQQLVRGFESRVLPALRSELALNSNEQCAKWLSEDPWVAATRSELLTKCQRLEDAARELDVMRML